jgi:hypothetical protein
LLTKAYVAKWSCDAVRLPNSQIFVSRDAISLFAVEQRQDQTFDALTDTARHGDSLRPLSRFMSFVAVSHNAGTEDEKAENDKHYLFHRRLLFKTGEVVGKAARE